MNTFKRYAVVQQKAGLWKLCRCLSTRSHFGPAWLFCPGGCDALCGLWPLCPGMSAGMDHYGSGFSLGRTIFVQAV